MPSDDSAKLGDGIEHEEDRRSPGYTWPDGYERTDPSDRESYPGDLQPTRKESFVSIVDELEDWGATDVRINTASQHYADRPNIPHQHDKPDDTSVIARFRRVDEPADAGYAIACDRWETQLENARAIALYARRMRLSERCGVTTASSTMSTARLPPGDEEDSDDVIVSGPPRDESASDVLGVKEDAPDAAVRGAFRELSKDRHPDQGGSDEEMRRLISARDELLNGDSR